MKKSAIPAASTRDTTGSGMSFHVTVYYNCQLLRNGTLVKDDLWTKGSLIVNPAVVNYECDMAVDCQGTIIAPGFIDLKLNGAFGKDFSRTDDIEASIAHVAQRLPAFGVTAFCPTLVSSSKEYYHRVLPQVTLRPGTPEQGAGVLGVHLDGPFLSRARPGAHQDPQIVDSLEKNIDTVRSICGPHFLHSVRLITLAPELPGTLETILQLTQLKPRVRVLLGHSSCSLAVAETAVKAGASMISHLFNAMPAFHHRDPSLAGLLGSSLPEIKNFYFGIIADGHHTHAAALRMAHRTVPHSIFLISDGVAPLGLGEGDFTLGGAAVTVEPAPPADAGSLPNTQATPDDTLKNDNNMIRTAAMSSSFHAEAQLDGPTASKCLRCTVTKTETLSGSVAPLDTCLRNFRFYTGCSIVEALEAVTSRPAMAMGVADSLGTLAFGARADFVLLDLTLHVRETYIAGQKVYPAAPASMA